MDLHLHIVTALGKVVWKMRSCLCSRSPQFTTPMLFKKSKKSYTSSSKIERSTLVQIQSWCAFHLALVPLEKGANPSFLQLHLWVNSWADCFVLFFVMVTQPV